MTNTRFLQIINSLASRLKAFATMFSQSHCGFFASVLVWSILVPHVALNATVRPQDPMEAVEQNEGVARGEQLPGVSSSWFDSETGTLRVPDEIESMRLEDRNQWVAPPAKKWNWKWNWNWGGNWGSTGFFGTTIFRVFGSLLLGVVLAALIWGLFKLFSSVAADSSVRNRANSLSKEELAAKVSQLPFQMEPAEDLGLMALIEQSRKNRDYDQATIYLFGHVLVSLDVASLIRLQRGKTNRMYQRDLRATPKAREFYTDVMLLFERAFFGRHRISESGFEKVFAELGEFEATLARFEEKSNEMNRSRVTQGAALS